MEYHLLRQDNLAAITDMESYDIDQIIRSDPIIPYENNNILGDIVIFEIPHKDRSPSGWYIGRLCSVDPMTEPVKIENIDHVFYHRFPTTSYIYTSFEGKLVDLSKITDEIDEIQKYDIIYPPILVFPDGLPASLEENTLIDIWLATSGDRGEEEEYVAKAKIHRSYSYNYVSSLLDFTNLPDYNEDENR